MRVLPAQRVHRSAAHEARSASSIEIIAPPARGRALATQHDTLSLRRAATCRLVAGGTAPYIAQQIGQMMAVESAADDARAAATAAYRRAGDMACDDMAYDDMTNPWAGIAAPAARLSV